MPRHLMPWALFQNPWINHFRHPAASHIVSADSATASNMRKFSNNTLSLDLQENEEVESQQFKGPPPNAATPIISHHQNASANLISEFFYFYPLLSPFVFFSNNFYFFFYFLSILIFVSISHSSFCIYFFPLLNHLSKCLMDALG